jgi:hypothetical protein
MSVRPQSRVGYFQHDAAYVFVGEKIGPGELQIVQRTHRVEEEGIAAPAREEAVVAGLRHPCIPPGRDWNSLKDNLAVIASRRSLCALNAAQRRRLCPTLGGREAHPVRNVSDGIPVRVNLELVQRIGSEWLRGSRSRRTQDNRRVGVHDQNRLACIARLGKDIQISEVQTRVRAREPKVGTGVMMRH